MKILVDKNPLPKGRPRFSGKHAYTPKKTADYETYVAQCANNAIRGNMLETELIAISLKFYRKGQVKADIDNLTKACLDALNGIAWKDDKQVRRLSASVEYGHKTGYAIIEIEVITEGA